MKIIKTKINQHTKGRIIEWAKHFFNKKSCKAENTWFFWVMLTAFHPFSQAVWRTFLHTLDFYLFILSEFIMLNEQKKNI